MDQRIIFLPLLIISNIVISAWWYQRPQDMLWLSIALVVINVFSAWWLGRSRKDWWIFSLLPLFLLLSGLSYSLMFGQQFLALGIISISTLGSILYWRLVFLYAFRQGAFRPFSLEKSSNYLSLLTIFFSTASIFGLKIFIDLPLWQLLSAAVITNLAVITQWLWFEKIVWRTHWVYGVLMFLALLEFYIVFSFLPINFHILGFSMAVMWYALSTIVSDQLSGHPSSARARFVLIITLVATLAVLLTARWF